MLPNSFYKASITPLGLKAKKDKTLQKKDRKKGRKKDRKEIRPLSLINTDATILKYLQTELRKYITRIIHHNQVGFIPRRQG